MKGRQIKPETLDRFIAELAERGRVDLAAAAVGVHRFSLYRIRHADPAFARRWDEAIDAAVQALEDEAVRRARDGVEEPVFYQGAECGRIRRYSDSLLIQLLKAHRPEKYRERSDVNVRGSLDVRTALVNASLEDLQAAREALAAQLQAAAEPAPAVESTPTAEPEAELEDLL
jgi:hypothetical protein